MIKGMDREELEQLAELKDNEFCVCVCFVFSGSVQGDVKSLCLATTCTCIINIYVLYFLFFGSCVLYSLCFSTTLNTYPTYTRGGP